MWDNNRWFPAMQAMGDWQCGATSICRQTDIPNTLVTMPDRHYWSRLTPYEETQPRIQIGRPWIPESHVQDISHDAPTPRFAYPAHIIEAVLEHAESTKKICPIMMEPIEKATATLTACGHIFQKAALTEWLKTHQTCPECRHGIPC